MTAVCWIAKIIVVVGLLGAAAAVATPRGRLPLALRGVRRMMRQDRGEKGTDAAERGEAVSGRRKFSALLLVIIAIIIATL